MKCSILLRQNLGPNLKQQAAQMAANIKKKKEESKKEKQKTVCLENDPLLENADVNPSRSATPEDEKLAKNIF